MPKHICNRGVPVLVVAVLLSWTRLASAYGPVGHRLVGEIADARLADKPVEKKIEALLDGLTLGEAALLPDDIKSWDKHGPDVRNTFHLSKHKSIDAQLNAFWKANQPKGSSQEKPNHHWFHYTDVPVFKADEKYDGPDKPGRSKWDIVQMIPFCISVLDGSTPEDNDRAITKPVAVILLAHYLGDIHQPLHVGAEYFDVSSKQPAVPSENRPQVLGDEGGNLVVLVLHSPNDHGRGSTYGGLHGYWDNEAVKTALQIARDEVSSTTHDDASEADVVAWMAKNEPAHWNGGPQGNPKMWAEAWADEILPLARQAHEQLIFSDIHRQTGLAAATGEEKSDSNGGSYEEWAGQTVKEEIHKAGWRLAALLERVVK